MHGVFHNQRSDIITHLSFRFIPLVQDTQLDREQSMQYPMTGFGRESPDRRWSQCDPNLPVARVRFLAIQLSIRFRQPVLVSIISIVLGSPTTA
jgi:hypothetical protein